MKLDNLPNDILKHGIGQFLDEQSLGKMRLVSTFFNKAYAPEQKAKKLLDLIYKADYESVKAMVIKEPELMFEKTLYSLPNQPPIFVSPLQLSCILLDKYMWQMFFDVIKNNSNTEQNIKSLQLFKNQAQNIKHIGLSGFFSTYEEFSQLWKAFRTNNSLMQKFDEEHQKIGAKIGKAQRDELPKHFLKEFLRPDEYKIKKNKKREQKKFKQKWQESYIRNWDKNSQFNYSSPSENLQLRNESSVLVFLNCQTDCLLIRGQGKVPRLIKINSETFLPGETIQDDYAQFLLLVENRKNDLQQFLDKLDNLPLCTQLKLKT